MFARSASVYAMWFRATSVHGSYSVMSSENHGRFATVVASSASMATMLPRLLIAHSSSSVMPSENHGRFATMFARSASVLAISRSASSVCRSSSVMPSENHGRFATMVDRSVSVSAMLFRAPIAHRSSSAMPSENHGRPATVLANSVSLDAMLRTRSRAIDSPSVTPSATHGIRASASARSESWIHTVVSTPAAVEWNVSGGFSNHGMISDNCEAADSRAVGVGVLVCGIVVAVSMRISSSVTPSVNHGIVTNTPADSRLRSKTPRALRSTRVISSSATHGRPTTFLARSGL